MRGSQGLNWFSCAMLLLSEGEKVRSHRDRPPARAPYQARAVEPNPVGYWYSRVTARRRTRGHENFSSHY